MVLCWRFLRQRWLLYILISLSIFPFVLYLTQMSPVSHHGSSHITGGVTGVGGCVRPHMEVWHDSLKTIFVKPKPLQCQNAQENWVTVLNGTFIIKPGMEQKHGNITCEYQELISKDDDRIEMGHPIKPFLNGSKILSDFFQVHCSSAKGDTYKNLHSSIKMKENLPPKSLPENTLDLNILMFGFDSTSRLNFIRNLPNSYEYITKELGAVVLEGYNIVGDGTPQALLPILTGKSEEELPESRRGFANAQTVDNHPWIWTDLKNHGYVTQWGEDMANVGTFTYRMLGFHKQPVDHYMRPFYRYAEKNYYKKNKPLCLGSLPRHLNMLNWVRDFFDAYPQKPKFSFVFHSEFSHGSFSMLSLADKDVLDFVKYMKAAGHLDNTLLILMADHGARFTKLRHTQQGKYEERLPIFSFILPQQFREKHPKAFKNLKSNVDILTTPFDIHETLRDIISYQGDEVGNLTERGISLFKRIPRERTCSHAHIEPHWCMCMDWNQISKTDDHVIESANEVVKYINSMIATHEKDCEFLYLDVIESALKFSPKERMLKFAKSADFHGRRGKFTDNMKATTELYQVTITMKPGGAKYEATIKYETYNHNVTYSTDSKSLSRINRYGNQPHCIMDEVPHLRAYCYCKIQL